MSHDKDTLHAEPMIQAPVTHGLRRFGLIVVLCFFGGFGLWSVLARIDSAAMAPGKITVAGNRRTIQHLEGGIVKKIWVKEGSRVEKGAVLVELQDTRAKSIYDMRKNEAEQLLAQETRLVAEQLDRSTLVLNARIKKRTTSASLANMLANQKDMLLANQSAHQGHVLVLKQRIAQLAEQIKGTQAQLKSVKHQQQLIKKELKSIRYLFDQKLVERSRLLSVERESATLQGLAGEHQATIAMLEQKTGEAQLDILALGVNKNKEVLVQLRDVREALSNAIEKETASYDVWARTQIKAPQAGLVVGLNIHTMGGVIKPGEAVMDILPSNDRLVVEAKVSPLDIDIVTLGCYQKYN